MRITVVGAGNMGLALAGYLALKEQYQVTLFTRKDVLVQGPLIVEDVEAGTKRSTDRFTVSADPEAALSSADIVLCTYPAFLRRAFVENYQDYFSAGTALGFIPGYGGAEFFCHQLVKKGVILFALQRVPYVARASKNQQQQTVAGILSKKSMLYAAAIPKSHTLEIATLVQQLLDIPCAPLKEYLSITLAPSNPLLHISGLYGVFKDCSANDRFCGPLRFYEQWNDDTSRLLFAYDTELQQICRALAPLDMQEVVPLPEYYESPTPEAMTKKLKSIPAFHAVMVPLTPDSDGYTIDLQSRMFVEDYPYGVCIIKDFARIVGVETPVVDTLLDFYYRLSGHRYFHEDGTYTPEAAQTGMPGLFGLHTVEDIVNFYHK